MSMRKLINTTKNTLCKQLQRACRLLSTAAYVGTSMWLVMKPVGAHKANMRDTTPIHQFDFGSSTAQENVRESEGVDLAEKHGFFSARKDHRG